MDTIAELEARLPLACNENKTYSQGGLNVDHMITLAQYHGLHVSYPAYRHDLILLLCRQTTESSAVRAAARVSAAATRPDLYQIGEPTPSRSEPRPAATASSARKAGELRLGFIDLLRDAIGLFPGPTDRKVAAKSHKTLPLVLRSFTQLIEKFGEKPVTDLLIEEGLRNPAIRDVLHRMLDSDGSFFTALVATVIPGGTTSVDEILSSDKKGQNRCYEMRCYL